MRGAYRVRVEVQRKSKTIRGVHLRRKSNHTLPSSSSAATGAAEQRPLDAATAAVLPAAGAAGAGSPPFPRHALVASTDALAPWARTLAAAAEGAALASKDDILRKR